MEIWPVIPGFARHVVRNGPMEGTARYISDDERYVLRYVMQISTERWYWHLADTQEKAELRFLDIEDVLTHIKLVAGVKA